MTGDYARVFLLCVRMLRDPDEAATAAQDAFLRAYRRYAKTSAPPIEDPRRWMTRLAVNVCLDRLKLRRWNFFRRRAPAALEETVLAFAPAAGPDPERLAASRQIARRIEAAMDRLSDKQRTAFVLRHFEGLAFEEIGEVMGVDTGTAKTHLARAFGKLREELEDLYGR